MKSEIIELQERTVQSIFNLAKSNNKIITVKAPTGSGKTHIMANFMNKILADDESIIFIVSILSKGQLASQNYDSFNDLALKDYTRLRPFYISSGNENSKNTEYSLYIDDTCNVFVLPTSQYTENSRIHKERVLQNFLNNCKKQNKKIILVRDECHIATNKLEKISGYFYQTINFSATPKNDEYDVVITEDEAVEVNLIKEVEYIDTDLELQEDLDNALNKFLEIKKIYNHSGINPAFIIQISNKNKAEEEVEVVKKIVESKGLNWVYFAEIDKTNGYMTNSKLSRMKNKTQWYNYVKENNSFIDVVIFKMVITEGFDIPRACMLYQVRDSKSKQLDEQVIGRVRRNPCLTYFEKLNKIEQDIFSKAYIYGIKPQENDKRKVVTQLRGIGLIAGNEIAKEFRPFKIIELKEVSLDNIDIVGSIDTDRIKYSNKSIFNMYQELNKVSDKVKDKYYEYVTDYSKWYEFMTNLDNINEKIMSVVEDYDKYGQIKEEDSIRQDNESFFYKNDFMGEIDNWIWVTDDNEYSFDSDAERSFFKILKQLIKRCCKSIEIDGEDIYLFGKNFIDKSNIRYDYYHRRQHTSYPDFIFKDKKDNVHIFEVKSVNKGLNYDINDEYYKEKIEKLKKAYIYASKMTGYIFYLPIQNGNDWQIWRCKKGIVDTNLMNKDTFNSYMQEIVSK